MTTEITICKKDKRITFPVHRASILEKITGLMFRTRETSIILFKFKHPTTTSIHSYFVFFPFLAVWMNEKNQVTSFQKVTPFTMTIKPSESFTKLIEIPFSRRNKDIIKFFVGNKKI
jgi:uncharacterized membrane protein (UPF0127 family)